MSQTLTVGGMSCSHCEQTVESALESVEGVTNALADRESESVTVDGKADTDSLVDAVEDAGYEAAASAPCSHRTRIAPTQSPGQNM